VERISEYCSIPQEPPAIIESYRPTADWPSRGSIQVRKLCIKYSPDLPQVLQDVSFDVFENEKVAVVGRTGAGKSTLSLAFFRIVPITSGSITIDGLDISDIGLYDLRSNLTMIPQDPVLFTGDLRSNLDPLCRFDDETIWNAIKKVHFLESMQKELPDSNTITFDYQIQENGGNFSQGQRQLLCLARSLLQGNKIVILDEATASIDNDTDKKIQNSIRTEFLDCTIICIAHRLRTIIDYDKVLVLDEGKLVEFGPPFDLIKSGGVFASMCEETGQFDELFEMAKQKRNKHIMQVYLRLNSLFLVWII
jgi:ABC-type multidrug transport system fused ATPase/permease subunit